MSQEHVHAVREAFAALLHDDVESFLRLLADDVDWRPSAFLTGTGRYEGVDGVRRWLNDLAELRRQGSIIDTYPRDYRDLGDRVVVLGHGILTRETGSLREELGWIWDFRDGKVVAMVNHLSHERTLAEAGLTE